jgi:hypothetical protein
VGFVDVALRIEPIPGDGWSYFVTLDVEQGMLSEVAEKMVDGNYFATMTILEGTAGTPL